MWYVWRGVHMAGMSIIHSAFYNKDSNYKRISLILENKTLGE